MGVEFLFPGHGLYGLEEVFHRGILEYESLHTGFDEIQDLLFRFVRTEIAGSFTAPTGA